MDHKNRVLALADFLESNGIEVIFDQYAVNPNEGWSKWIESGIERANFILVICTGEYCKRVQERQSDGGFGAQFEGTLIYNTAYNDPEHRSRILIVQWDIYDVSSIPRTLQDRTRYIVSSPSFEDAGTQSLYRVLTNQPEIVKPSRGSIKQLQPLNRTNAPRSGVPLSIFEESFSSNMIFQTASHDPSISSKRQKLIRGERGTHNYRDSLARAYYREGNQYIAQDDFATALQYMQKSIRLDGSLQQAHEELVLCLVNSNKYEEASHHLSTIQVEQDWPILEILRHEVRVVLNIDTFDYISTKVLSDKFISDKLVHNRLTMSLVRMGQFEIAEQLHRKHLASMLSESSDQASLAYYLWKNGKVKQAVSLMASLDTSKFGVTEWCNYAVGLAVEGRFGLALRALERAKEVKAGGLFIYYSLAQIYAVLGDVEECILNLEILTVKEATTFLNRIWQDVTFSTVLNDAEFKRFCSELKGVSGAMSVE